MGADNTTEAEREVKEEDINDTTSTGSGAAEPEAGPEVEMLRSAMKSSCFIRDTSFIDLEGECELEAGSVITEN